MFTPTNNILVVEDSDTQRTIIQRELLSWNYNVLLAGDGVEGLEVFLSQSPRLVITDLEMPRMNGFDLIKAIRRHEMFYTYITVLSSLKNKENVVAALSLGADDYLNKPFYPEELKVRLKGGERLLRLESQEMLIFAMARLAESRSRETGFHLERVQHYTRAIAEELLHDKSKEITPAWINNLVSFSSLHDIGKVAIPDMILNKTAKLTPVEFQVIQKHTTIGGQLINDIQQKTGSVQLALARDIVLYHHERFDGLGYPEKLSEEAIPLAARIVALADVYDALSTQRCYKPAFPRAQCQEIILQEKGRHFDPDVVDAFSRQEELFWEIKQRFPV